jgi:nicotinate phosphoribosyltransferase
VRGGAGAGEAVTERIWLAPPVEQGPAGPGPADRVLLHDLVRDGKVVGREPLADARARHAEALAELPSYALQLSRGYPAIPTVFGPDPAEPQAQ